MIIDHFGPWNLQTPFITKVPAKSIHGTILGAWYRRRRRAEVSFVVTKPTTKRDLAPNLIGGDGGLTYRNLDGTSESVTVAKCRRRHFMEPCVEHFLTSRTGRRDGQSADEGRRR